MVPIVPPRIAIVGGSCRAAAASARRAGWSVVAADRFADANLALIADVTRVADYEQELPAWLRSQDADGWLYVGGLENHPQLVAKLSQIRPLWGASDVALAVLRDPFALAMLAAESAVPFPETQADWRTVPRDGAWLAKTYRQAGGAGVWILDEDARQRCERTQCVTQRRIVGRSGAAVFVSTPSAVRLLGVTEQLVGETFRYEGSHWPYPEWTAAKQELLIRFANAVVRRSGVVGVWGVDFVDDGAQVWPVEVNPRYTASCELIEAATNLALVDLHVRACRDGEIPAEAFAMVNSPRGKRIVYARRAVTITTDLAQGWLVAASAIHPTVADVPCVGTTIPAGAPVLTVFFDTDPQAAVAAIEQQLYGDNPLH